MAEAMVDAVVTDLVDTDEFLLHNEPTFCNIYWLPNFYLECRLFDHPGYFRSPPVVLGSQNRS
jgi:hypothetical protein